VCNVGTDIAHSAYRHEQTGHCSTAHREWLTVQISVSVSSVFRTVLHSAVHSDNSHKLSTSVCVPVHHTHLAHHPDSSDSTTDRAVSSVFRTVLHSAVHSDSGHTLTTSVCIPVHYTHLTHHQTVLTAHQTL
jgi:hypothetical protein